MTRSFLLLLAVAATTAAVPAAADTSYTITETLIGEWLWDNGNAEPDDDYYIDIKNRLNIGIVSEGIDAGLRVDTATFRFLDPSWLSGDTAAERDAREEDFYARHGITKDEETGEYGHVGDYRLERAYARVQLARDWQLTGGDFYAHLGRGLLLSLRKIDELGIDNSLRGGRIEGRFAERVDVALMGGLTNVTNVDETYNLIVQDPLDVVAAARVAVDLWGGNRIALHVMDVEPHTDAAVERRTVGYGGALEFADLPWGLRLYAEVDGLHRELAAGNTDEGIGAYADLSWSYDPVQIGLEYKEYHSFGVYGSSNDAADVAWAYNRPPLADLEDQLIESEYDVRGGRLKANWQIADWVDVFVAFAGADDLREYEGADRDAVHAYGGLELRWDEGLSFVRALSGYRYTWQMLHGAAEEYRTLVHARLDAAVHLWGPLSLQLNVQHEEWTKDDMGNMLDYRRGTVALSFDWSGIGSVIGTFEYDDEFANREHYFGSFGLQVSALEWLTVRGRIGSLRGGEKCIAGACRQYPPFDGVRLEVIFRL